MNKGLAYSMGEQAIFIREGNTMTGFTIQEVSGDLKEFIDTVKKTLDQSDTYKITTELSSAMPNTVESEVESLASISLVQGRTVINLVPMFTSGTWSLPTGFTTISPNKLQLVTSTTDVVAGGSGRIYPEQSTQYTIKAKFTGSMGVTEYDANSQQLAYHLLQSNVPLTFTTNASTSFIRIWVNNSIVGIGTFTFEDVMMVKGTTVQPFVANIKGVTNPTIENTTNGTRLTALTTLYEGESLVLKPNGLLQKNIKFLEIPLLENFAYVYGIDSDNNTAKRINITGVKNIAKDVSLASLKNHQLVKHDGTILTHGTTTKKDSFNNVDNDLSVSVPNDDSGWASGYTPLPEEIRAYFLGYEMGTLVDSVYQPGYNGTGTKYWRARNWTSTGYSSVPTTLVENALGKWQPYRLIAEADTTVKMEVVKTHGDLILDKGTNNLVVKTGLIAREVAKTKHHSSFGTGYYINGNATGISAPLQFATNSILEIYKNGIRDTENWSRESGNINSYGGALAYNRHTHDASAVYTVDYEPLYVFEVSSPVDKVTINHNNNLSSTIGELVNIASKLSARTSELEQGTVKKGEDITWITPILLNGLTAVDATSCRYGKDSMGNVHVKLRFQQVGNSNNTLVARLPVGFRPDYPVPCTGTVTNDGTTFYFYISSNGDMVVNTANLGTKTLAVDKIFKVAR